MMTGNAFVEEPTGTYYILIDGIYSETSADTENDHLYDGGGLVTYTLESTATIDTMQEGIEAEAFVDVRGELIFGGLGAGTYTLTEIVTPDGYNGIDPMTHVISFDEATNTFTATANGSPISSVNNQLSMTIINTAGQLLPSTGGIGTIIFYVLGSVLVAGTLIFFVSKKSASDEKSK